MFSEGIRTNSGKNFQPLHDQTLAFYSYPPHL